MPIEVIKTSGLSLVPFDDDLEVIVSVPELADLPDGDPLKQSKKAKLGDVLGKCIDWDVTPVVNTNTPTLSIVQSNALSINGLAISTNYTDAPNNTSSEIPLHIGVAKTNIDLTMLEVGKAFHFSFTINTSVSLLGALIAGMYFGSASKMLTEIRNDIAALFAGPASVRSVTTAYLNFMMLAIGVNRQAQFKWGVPTDTTPSLSQALAHGSSDGTPPNAPKVVIDNNTKLTAVVARKTDRIILSLYVIAPDGVNYDIVDVIEILNNPLLPETTTLYFYTVGGDMGAGYPPITITPSLGIAIPSLDVTDTTYAENGGTNFAINAALDMPIAAPSGLILTQKTFPPNVKAGRFLKAIIDDGYVGVVNPYGITVENNTLCVVDSVEEGSESFVPFAKLESINELRQDISAAGLQIANLTDLVSAKARLSETSELIVYVKRPIDAVTTEPVLSGNNVYATFDEAYNYLISQPTYIRKRIVIDDAESWNLSGSLLPEVEPGIPREFRKYALMANWIKISTNTYFQNPSRFNDGTLDTSYNLGFGVVADGFYFEDAHLATITLIDENNDAVPLIRLDEGVTLSNGRYTEDNLIFGKNTYIFSNYTHFFADGGGTVVMEPKSAWEHTFGYNITVDQPTRIFKAASARLKASGYIPDLANNGEKSLIVYAEDGGYDVENSQSLSQSLSVVYITGNASPTFYYDNAVMVRELEDLVAVGGFYSANVLTIPGNRTYFVVGSVNLGTTSIYLPNPYSEPIKFIGLPGSKLISNSFVFFNNGPTGGVADVVLDIDGVDIISNSSDSINMGGTLRLRNCKVFGSKLVVKKSTPGVPHDFIAIGVDFLGNGGARMPQPNQIDVSGKVVIRDVTGLMAPNKPLFALTVKSIDSGRNDTYDIRNVKLQYENSEGLGSHFAIDLIGFRSGVDTHRRHQINYSDVKATFGDLATAQYIDVFRNGGVVFDYLYDEAITTDNKASFALATVSNYTATLPSSGVLLLTNLPTLSFEETSDFVFSSGLITYTGSAPRVIRAEFSVTFTPLDNNVSVSARFVRTPAANVFVNGSTLAKTAGETYVLSASTVLLLRAGDRINVELFKGNVPSGTAYINIIHANLILTSI